MQGVKREERRDTARAEHWTRVLFDTCVTSETRPGNQTESNQIKNLLKALSLEKALGLVEVVESPRLPGAFGGELGTRRAVHRRTWSSSQASLSCCGTSKRSFMLGVLSPHRCGVSRSKDDKNRRRYHKRSLGEPPPIQAYK
jgi:hypothetical protein